MQRRPKKGGSLVYCTEISYIKILKLKSDYKYFSISASINSSSSKKLEMKDTARSRSLPEPLPDCWEEGSFKVDWERALLVHCYVFGTIFFAVVLYAVCNLVKLCRSQIRKSKNYFICIAMLICMFCLTRALMLLTDSYSTGRPFHVAPGYSLILLSLGYPCLTSGFFLINWSLVEVTKLQLLPSLIYKRKVLALVIITHFVVVVTFDTIFLFFPSTYVLLFICRSLFVLWGILLFGGFIVAALRIRIQVKRTLRNINTINDVDKTATAGNRKRLEQARCMKVTKVASRAAGTGLLICCTQIYILWEFYVFHNNDIVPKAWPWWTYQTCFRCIELFMVYQMFLVIRPKK